MGVASFLAEYRLDLIWLDGTFSGFRIFICAHSSLYKNLLVAVM